MGVLHAGRISENLSISQPISPPIGWDPELFTTPAHFEKHKAVVIALHQLEWLFINARVDEQYKPYRDKLALLIRQHLENLSLLKMKKPITVENGFFAPTKVDYLIEAQKCLEKIYLAIVNNTNISAIIKDKESGEKKGESPEDLKTFYAVAACLRDKDKHAALKIIEGNEIMSERLELLTTTHRKVAY